MLFTRDTYFAQFEVIRDSLLAIATFEPAATNDQVGHQVTRKALLKYLKKIMGTMAVLSTEEQEIRKSKYTRKYALCEILLEILEPLMGERPADYMIDNDPTGLYLQRIVMAVYHTYDTVLTKNSKVYAINYTASNIGTIARMATNYSIGVYTTRRMVDAVVNDEMAKTVLMACVENNLASHRSLSKQISEDCKNTSKLLA